MSLAKLAVWLATIVLGAIFAPGYMAALLFTAEHLKPWLDILILPYHTARAVSWMNEVKRRVQEKVQENRVQDNKDQDNKVQDNKVQDNSPTSSSPDSQTWAGAWKTGATLAAIGILIVIGFPLHPNPVGGCACRFSTAQAMGQVTEKSQDASSETMASTIVHRTLDVRGESSVSNQAARKECGECPCSKQTK